MANDSEVYFRWCHVCGLTTESAGESVKKCEHCGKVMAPFFYFDDREHPEIGDIAKLSSVALICSAPKYRRLMGLSVFWRTNDV